MRPVQAQHPHSATLVADYMLSRSEAPLTMLQVLKLTYISHGWHLAMFNGRPLITDKIEAWKYGPVIPTLYQALRAYGKGNINKLIYCGTLLNTQDIKERLSFMRERIHEQSLQLIDKVLAEYSDLGGIQLSALTHQECTPWSKSYVEGQLFTVIPNSVIQQHYEKLARQRSRAGGT